MNKDIRSFIQDHPVVDVHEHHMPATFLSRNVGLLRLFDESYAGWTRQRPYRLPSEPLPALEDRGGCDTWHEVSRYLEHSGSSTFVRNLVWALTSLYDLGETGITEGNWAWLDQEIRKRHQDPGWISEVLDRARVRCVISDPYDDPLLDAHTGISSRHVSVLRINALAVGWHPDSCDHNGNSVGRFAERLSLRIETFDDYLDMLRRLVDTLGDRHQVALKNALAYDREINFDDTDEILARQAWGKSNPTPRERKAFGDVVVDHLCRLAGERDIPVQMHLGTAIVRGSHPMSVAGLVERHSRTRFLLMHLAYPWSQDLLGLAFVYRNIWLDLTWSWLLSPSYFSRVLHEAIELLPDESRLMLGGDNWHVEETFGSLSLARRLIGDVLEQKLGAGYFTESDARRLARKILHDNAIAFFKLPQ